MHPAKLVKNTIKLLLHSYRFLYRILNMALVIVHLDENTTIGDSVLIILIVLEVFDMGSKG